MARKQIYSKASDVCADEGVVNVDGPDGVDVGLTPDAAIETLNRLLNGAMEAAGQRHGTGGGRSGETRRPGDTCSDTGDEPQDQALRSRGEQTMNDTAK